MAYFYVFLDQTDGCFDGVAVELLRNVAQVEPYPPPLPTMPPLPNQLTDQERTLVTKHSARKELDDSCTMHQQVGSLKQGTTLGHDIMVLHGS